MIKEIEHFFFSYNESKGKQFEVLGRSGPERAKFLVTEGGKAYTRQRQSTRSRSKSNKKGRRVT